MTWREPSVASDRDPTRGRDLIAEAQPIVGAAGFTRLRGRLAFVRTNDDTIELLSFQKSRFANAYYLNYGIWMRALGRPRPLIDAICHVRLRGGDFMRSKKKLATCLDLASGRSAGLGRLLAREFLPFAESGRSLPGLRRANKRGMIPDAFITAAARAKLA